MHELEDYSYTPSRSLEEGSMKICILCHSEISQKELKKGAASWLPAGAGLRFSVHNTCLEEVEQAIEEQRQQEQEANEAVEFIHEISSLAKREMRKHR